MKRLISCALLLFTLPCYAGKISFAMSAGEVRVIGAQDRPAGATLQVHASSSVTVALLTERQMEILKLAQNMQQIEGLLQSSPCAFVRGLDFNLQCDHDTPFLLLIDGRNRSTQGLAAIIGAWSRSSQASDRLSEPNSVTLELIPPPEN